MFPKYPKMQSLRDTPKILNVPVVYALEKLHGTNFRIFLPARAADVVDLFGAMRLGSRNLDLTFGDDPRALVGQKFFGGGPLAWVRDNFPRLAGLRAALDDNGVGDVVLFGEMVGRHIQHGVTYGPEGETAFLAFDLAEVISKGAERLDVRDETALRFFDTGTMLSYCAVTGIPTAPVLYVGPPDIGALNALLEIPSVLATERGAAVAGEVSEGVVIRPAVEGVNRRGDRLIAKHKARGFIEQAGAPKGTRAGPITDAQKACQAFADAYVTRGRVQNAMGRVAEARGDADFHPRDTPAIIEAVWADMDADMVANERGEMCAEFCAMKEAQVRTEDIRRQCGRAAGTLFKAELAAMAMRFEHRAEAVVEARTARPTPEPFYTSV